LRLGLLETEALNLAFGASAAGSGRDTSAIARPWTAILFNDKVVLVIDSSRRHRKSAPAPLQIQE
jgi:hypothetical protein